jgi:hypothetical protein
MMAQMVILEWRLYNLTKFCALESLGMENHTRCSPSLGMRLSLL